MRHVGWFLVIIAMGGTLVSACDRPKACKPSAEFAYRRSFIHYGHGIIVPNKERVQRFDCQDGSIEWWPAQ